MSKEIDGYQPKTESQVVVEELDPPRVTYNPAKRRREMWQRHHDRMDKLYRQELLGVVTEVRLAKRRAFWVGVLSGLVVATIYYKFLLPLF